jgi:hypothetical protein
MELLIVFDSGSEEPLTGRIMLTMAYELLTVLLGGCAGAALMVYLASRPNYGQVKNSLSAETTTYAPTTERAIEVAEAPVAVSSAPSPASEPAPAPAMYETVQPAPAPVTYAAPSSTSFGAPTLTRKPTRTYRRRTAPVRSAAAPKKALAAKRKKR